MIGYALSIVGYTLGITGDMIDVVGDARDITLKTLDTYVRKCAGCALDSTKPIRTGQHAYSPLPSRNLNYNNSVLLASVAYSSCYSSSLNTPESTARPSRLETTS